MRYLLLLLLVVGCKEKKERWTTTVYSLETHIEMPSEFKEATGYDSIQLVCGPDGNNLRANFCFPNQWNVYYNKGVFSDVSGTGTVTPASKWTDAVRAEPTASKYDLIMQELDKFEKKILAAIEKNKCKREVIILEQPDDGFRNMPHLPDRTDPRFDTNAYKILLHSNN